MRKTGNTKVGGVVNIRFIETLLNESFLLLTRYGETRADAERLARRFVLSFCQKAGGQNIYFPKSLKGDFQSKYAAIRKEFRTGSSIQELVDKHELSGSRIYEIIKMKDTDPAGKDTSIRQVLLIETVRMLAKVGIEKEDALNAAKGLTAVILTRCNGLIFSLPSLEGTEILLRNIEIYRRHKTGKSICTIAKQFGLSEPEIVAIIEAHPPMEVPGTKQLPILRKQLFTMAESFRAYAGTNLPDTAVEVYTLLEAASNKISRAEQIMKKLEGEKPHRLPTEQLKNAYQRGVNPSKRGSSHDKRTSNKSESEA